MTMPALDWLAEKRIEDAVSRGEFENLPGAGRPLDLEDDALVPEELRVAHRVLKNAGLAARVVQEGNAEKKLSLLNARVDARYFRKVVRKLGGRA